MKTNGVVSLFADIRLLAPSPGANPILQDSTLRLQAGTLTCIVGPSGAGKTTLLRFLANDPLVEFEGEATYWDGGALSAGQAAKIGKLGLFLPAGALPPWQAVDRILLLPARLNRSLRRPNEEEISGVLARLRLPSATRTKKPSELSLGMRNRVLLALGLLYRPTYYFIDELFSALDHPTAELLLNILKTELQQAGSTCLIATHDLDRALTFADQIYYKDSGTRLHHVVEPTKSGLIELFETDYQRAAEEGRTQ